MFKAITLSEAKSLKTGTILHHKISENRDGTPSRARVNGKAKTWKRDPSKVKVPLKHGLYVYLYLTEENLNEWSIAK